MLNTSFFLFAQSMKENQFRNVLVQNGASLSTAFAAAPSSKHYTSPDIKFLYMIIAVTFHEVAPSPTPAEAGIQLPDNVFVPRPLPHVPPVTPWIEYGAPK